MKSLKRTIEQHPAVIETVSPDGVGRVKDWLEGHAVRHGLKWLLAYADDGIVWGKVENGRLLTSDTLASSVSPPFRSATLQSARLFARQAELLLWREGVSHWRARLICDARAQEQAKWVESLDECYVLWGTEPERRWPEGFTLMRDGSQGLRHAVPAVVSGTYDERGRPLRIWLRHYLEEDNNGFARIAASRLVDLTTEEAAE